MNEERRIENIPIDKIIPNIYQPRIKFDNKSIEDLSNSIKNHGIIQPLILRKIGEKYEIIDGERRYKAAKKIGLEKLPSIILDIEDKEAAELILTENMQKQLLTPIEEANAYQQIMLLNRFDIDELSAKLGKDRITIENKLKLLTLHPEIQEALLDNKISEGHAKSLTKINSRKEQLNLFYRILKERIPVKTLEELVTKENLSSESNNPFNKKEEKEQENKSEVEEMDNSQLNFNQYNNLLKEQEKPQMEANSTPEAILGNVVTEPKPNDFFPSLEEQPLNMEVPVENNKDIPISMQMPTFDTPNMAAPEVAPVQQNVSPVMEAPQNPMSEMAGSMAMPQFEVPSMPTAELAPMQSAMAPTMEVPQNPMPEMAGPMVMPQFEVPSMPTAELAPMQSAMAPTMEVPQNPMPEMADPMAMPQFEVPSMPTTAELAPMQSAMAPTMELQEPAPAKDVIPAVNMIKNLMPLLENAGYKIIMEETDNPSEYQFIIKVEK